MDWPASHISKGLLRLYLVLSIPWALGLGYVAYDSHQGYVSYRETAHEWLAKLEEAQDDPKAAAREQTLKRATGDDYRSMFDNNIFWRDKLQDREKLALKALPILPIGLPILWLAFVWVKARFRRT
jgi:hypothetical protein